jgi:hypothetical protein
VQGVLKEQVRWLNKKALFLAGFVFCLAGVERASALVELHPRYCLPQDTDLGHTNVQ